jgi:hypothetical protein
MKIVEIQQSERSIRRQLQRSTEQRRDIQACVLVGVDSEGSPDVAGRPGYVWARDSSSAADESGGVFPVLNAGVVQATINLPVLIGPTPRAPFQKQILGLNTDRIQSVQYNPAQTYNYYAIAAHAATHVNLRGGTDVNYGNDILYATDANILACLVFPDDPPSMRVYVNQGMYVHKGVPKIFSGGYTDYLWSSVPSLGLARLVNILVDGDTNSIEVLDGPSFAVQTPFVSPVPYQAIASIPLGRVLVGRIYLYAGVIAITETHFLYDAKPLLHTLTADGPYWLSDLVDIDPNLDPEEDDILIFNGEYWVTTPYFGSDVGDGTPTNGHILMGDGVLWQSMLPQSPVVHTELVFDSYGEIVIDSSYEPIYKDFNDDF